MIKIGILLPLLINFSVLASDYCNKNAKAIAYYKDPKNNLSKLVKNGMEKKFYQNSPLRSIHNLISQKCVTLKDIGLTDQTYHNYQSIYYIKRRSRLAEIMKMKADYKDVSKEIEDLKKIHSLEKIPFTNQEERNKEKKLISYYENNGKVRRESSLKQINQLNCSNKDNRTKALGRVRNQDTVGWCFSYVASDLLTHKTNKRVSSIGVAMSYYKESPKLSSAYAGDTRIAFNTALKDGLCLESDLPSDDFHYTLNGTSIKNKILPIVKRSEEINTQVLTKKREMFQKNIIGGANIKTWVDIMSFIQTGSGRPFNECSQEFKDLKYLFPNISYKDMNRIMGEVQVGELFQELKKANCKIFKPKQSMVAKSTYYNPNLKDRIAMIKKLNSILDKGDISGISYDPTLLSSKDSITNDGGHASSVVARRFNKKSNKCEYLIRNSWGAEYKSRLYENDNGNIWVPIEDLMGNTQRLHYVE